MAPVWQNRFAALTLLREPTCILELRVLTERPDWDEWRQLQSAVRTFYAQADAKGMRVCLLFELTVLGVLSPAMAHEWIALFQELREVTARIVRCSAMVIGTDLVRDAITFFLKTYNAARPIYVCASAEEALAKCAEGTKAS